MTYEEALARVRAREAALEQVMARMVGDQAPVRDMDRQLVLAEVEAVLAVRLELAGYGQVGDGAVQEGLAEALRVEFLKLTAANGRLEAENARLQALVEAHERTFRALDSAVTQGKEAGR